MVNRGRRLLTDRLLRNPVFLACLFTYVIFRLMLWYQPGHIPEFFRHHLADMLCLPVVLTNATLIQQHFVLNTLEYRLNKWQVVFAVMYFSVLFELIFPLFYSRYTPDIADVLAYAFGGMVFWIGINPESRNGH